MISSVHIIGGKAAAGAERFYVRLVNALHARGAPVLALDVADGAVSALLDAGVPQAHAAMRSVWDLPSRWRIGHLVRNRAPDIVQTYMGRATRLTRLPRKNRPVHVARLGGYYDLKGYRHAHAWVGNTRGICDYLIRSGLPAARVAWIGNFAAPAQTVGAAELQSLRQALGVTEDALVVVSVGRLHPVKGFEDLLAALARMPETIGERPLVLVIVGDGAQRQRLIEYAAQLGIAQRVRWTGWQDDPGPYYALADVFVCPSRHEPLGNVILEAWSYARPVLATRTDGALELVTEGEDAWLTPVQDPRSLARALQALLNDAGLRSALAAAGHRTVTLRHGEAAIVQGYLGFYARLLRG